MAISASSIVVVAYNIPLLGVSIVVVDAGMGDVGPWHGAAAGDGTRWRRIWHWFLAGNPTRLVSTRLTWQTWRVVDFDPVATQLLGWARSCWVNPT